MQHNGRLSRETHAYPGAYGVFPPLAPAGLSAQTLRALSRCRGPGALARKRGKRGRDVDAWRAKAPSPGLQGGALGPGSRR